MSCSSMTTFISLFTILEVVCSIAIPLVGSPLPRITYTHGSCWAYCFFVSSITSSFSSIMGSNTIIGCVELRVTLFVALSSSCELRPFNRLLKLSNRASDYGEIPPHHCRGVVATCFLSGPRVRPICSKHRSFRVSLRFNEFQVQTSCISINLVPNMRFRSLNHLGRRLSR